MIFSKTHTNKDLYWPTRVCSFVRNQKINQKKSILIAILRTDVVKQEIDFNCNWDKIDLVSITCVLEHWFAQMESVTCE